MVIVIATYVPPYQKNVGHEDEILAILIDLLG
jgi:hypothetical protein